MALEQTLVSSTRNVFTCFPKNTVSNAQIPAASQSLHPQISFHFSSRSKQSRFSGPSKCSVDYKEQYSHQVPYPRPAEVPWRKELSNMVHLIGVVGTPVEIKHLPSGKVLAWTRLAVKKTATDTSWINLTFWDELAHVAYQHVEKGLQIYVSGRLVSDRVENDDGEQQTYYKVVVQQLNFVERNSSSMAPNGYDSHFAMAGRKFGNNPASTGSIQELWQAFFANPSDWWDNRKNKRSPKYPDFKHKDTGEALWIEGRYNPPWVKSQLEILDSRMGSLNDQENRMLSNSMAGDEFMPF